MFYTVIRKRKLFNTFAYTSAVMLGSAIVGSNSYFFLLLMIIPIVGLAIFIPCYEAYSFQNDETLTEIESDQLEYCDFPSMPLWMLVGIICVTSRTLTIVKMSFFAVFVFLLLIGLIFYVLVRAGCCLPKDLSALEIIGCVIALAVAIAVGANYILSQNTLLSSKVLDKYEDDDTYILLISDEETEALELPVYIDTYEHTKVNDEIEILKKESVFGVTFLEDPARSNANMTILSKVGDNVKADIAIFIISLAIGLVISAMIMHGLIILLLGFAGTLLFGACTVTVFSEGEALWIKLMLIFLTALAVIVLLTGIMLALFVVDDDEEF